MEDQTLQAIEKDWQYNIENEELSVSLSLALVPENTAQGTKGLRSLADSGVHLKRCATVILHNAAKVMKLDTTSTGSSSGNKLIHTGLG